MLGNKELLEKRINIRASDYKFEDKKKYYRGYTNSRGQAKEGTKVKELLNLADTMDDFNESNIVSRNNQIIDGFIEHLRINGLLL